MTTWMAAPAGTSGPMACAASIRHPSRSGPTSSFWPRNTRLSGYKHCSIFLRVFERARCEAGRISRLWGATLHARGLAPVVRRPHRVHHVVDKPRTTRRRVFVNQRLAQPYQDQAHQNLILFLEPPDGVFASCPTRVEGRASSGAWETISRPAGARRNARRGGHCARQRAVRIARDAAWTFVRDSFSRHRRYHRTFTLDGPSRFVRRLRERAARVVPRSRPQGGS